MALSPRMAPSSCLVIRHIGPSSASRMPSLREPSPVTREIETAPSPKACCYLGAIQKLVWQGTSVPSARLIATIRTSDLACAASIGAERSSPAWPELPVVLGDKPVQRCLPCQSFFDSCGGRTAPRDRRAVLGEVRFRGLCLL